MLLPQHGQGDSRAFLLHSMQQKFWMLTANAYTFVFSDVFFPRSQICYIVDQVHFIMNSKPLTSISTPLMILSSREHVDKFIDHFTGSANVASDGQLFLVSHPWRYTLFMPRLFLKCTCRSFPICFHKLKDKNT